MFTRRIRTIEQLERELGAPVLGTLPHLRVRSTGISTVTGPSPRAQAARALTANVAALGATSVLVSAPSDGHGRSIVVANLAVGLAEGGAATLAVDLDDDGRLATLLGATAAEGTVRVRDDLDYVAGSNLEVADGYAHVIANGPVVADDTFAAVAEAFDGIILVVRAGTLGREDAQRVRAAVDGRSVLGTVLTDTDDEQPRTDAAVTSATAARPTHREIVEAELELARQEQPLEQREVTVDPQAFDPATATWSLTGLEAAVARVATTDPARAEELRFYLDALADHADEQGRISGAFGSLIRETFADLL